MPPSSPSTWSVAKVFFVVAGLAGTLYFIYLIRSTLALLVVSVFLAVALGPAVDFFHKRKVPRALAIVLVYFLLVATIVGIGLLIVPPIVTQVQDLANNLPHYIQDVRKNHTFRTYDEKYDISQKLTQQAQKLPDRLGSAADALRSITVGVFSAGVKLIAVLTITFLLLLDGKRIMNFAFTLLSPEREARYRRVASDIYRAVAGYVAGNLIISVIAGVITYTTLSILGVPFAVPLSVLVAFLDLIPLVGATLGGIAVGVVTLFNDFPTSTIVWVIVLIAYQQAENHLVQPLVYRSTVNVRPLIVIISILIGGSLLGVLGALMAIPVAATIQIILRDWWNLRQERIRAALGGDERALDPPEGSAGDEPATA